MVDEDHSTVLSGIELRGLLIRRGITSTVSALSMALGQHEVVAVPAGLACNIATAAAVASRESRQNGRPLAKTYAFADGHSEIFSSTEEGIEPWERARIAGSTTP